MEQSYKAEKEDYELWLQGFLYVSIAGTWWQS